MADRFAIAAGNWSNTSTWSTTAGGGGGASVPGVGDAAHLNNRAVVADVNIECDSITTRALNGATQGGSLTVTTDRTITASLWPGLTSIITISTAGITVNLIGEIQGSTTTNNIGSVIVSNASTVNITGNCIGGTGGTGAQAVRGNHASSLVNIVGDCFASAVNSAVNNVLGGVINITGNCYGSNSSATPSGITNSSSGTINITGNCYGSDLYTATTSPYGAGAHNNSTGIINLIGSAFGGKGSSPGISNQVSGGTLNIKRAVGGPGGPGMAAPVIGVSVGVLNTNSGGIVNVEEIEFGVLGSPPTQGSARFTDLVTNVCQVTLTDNSTKNLVDPTNVSGLVPNEEDVRNGVIYAGGINTGSCAVPPISSVAAGVPVDNSMGTAVITIPILASVLGQLLADALSD